MDDGKLTVGAQAVDDARQDNITSEAADTRETEGQSVSFSDVLGAERMRALAMDNGIAGEPETTTVGLDAGGSTGEPPVPGVQADDAPISGGQSQAQGAYRSQTEVDAAIQKRLAAERQKHAPANEVLALAMESLGAKDASEVKQKLTEMAAAKRADERGTNEAYERDQIELRQRISRMEQGATQTAEPGEDSRAWARAVSAEAQRIALERGDPGFVRELYTQGSEVSRRILAGELPEDVYAATRGARPSGIAAQRPQPAHVPQTPSGAGAPRGIDYSKLTLEDMAALDARVRRGERVVF